MGTSSAFIGTVHIEQRPSLTENTVSSAMNAAVPIRISKVENFGRKIILDDKTEWWVYCLDSFKSRIWLPTDEVIVRRNEDMDSWTV